MTDKERLEEIKSRVWRERCTYAVDDDSSREGYRYILSDVDYHWLMEQVERVEELEKDLDEWRNEALRLFERFEEYQESYLETKELNKRLREAIEKALGESGWGDEGNALYRTIGILTKALEGEE